MHHSELIDAVRSEVRYSYSRSAGPGGQNVNKVNTKVTARLPLSVLSGLGHVRLEQIERRLKGRINTNGELLVHVQEERSQARNREIATQRLIDLVLGALVQPRRRRPTRPSSAAKRARLEAKRRRSRTKVNRRRTDRDEE